MSHSSVILSTENLAVGYRSGKTITTVLRDLNLSLCRGELVCLLGANGIGKSTLLRTLSGVQLPLEGDVVIDGRKMSQCSSHELSRLISIVYTDRTLAGALTVSELVSLGRHPYTGFFGRLDRNDREVIASSLDAVGMSHKAGDYVATLSDGERQKVMIARALAQEAPVIILDEPTAFLDVASRIDTMRRLQDLAVNHNKAILLSSHDVNYSLTMASRLWLLRHDRTMIDGVTEDVVLNGDLNTLFSQNRDVIFDPIMGDFFANVTYSQSVTLDCTDAVLRHWVINALHRNGIGVVVDETSPAMPHIIASSPQNFTINNSPCTSIAELLAKLS